VDQLKVKELFDYKDGMLYWKKSNKLAGTKHDGYTRIAIKGKKYLAHRLVWLMTYGTIPAHLQIDHINGDRSDNSINNLRLVTNQGNQHNQHNAKGYSWHKRLNKWHAKIRNNSIDKHIGYYTTECGAHLAYLFAKLTRTLTT
tara:strand:+ start:59 stop:487 length:429 start_codon:yes stop_codon:yes gene_type:complete